MDTLEELKKQRAELDRKIELLEQTEARNNQTQETIEFSEDDLPF